MMANTGHQTPFPYFGGKAYVSSIVWQARGNMLSIESNDAGTRKLIIAIIKDALMDWQAYIPCFNCNKSVKCHIDIACNAMIKWRDNHNSAKRFFREDGFWIYAKILGYSDKIIAQARKDILYNKKEYFI